MPKCMDTAKAVLRRKFIVINTYIKKKERSQTNNLTSDLKKLEKEEQMKPKVSRRKDQSGNKNQSRNK